ncbi:DUF1653 domain-containing protein [Patescibacteria group bacterium]|nr:DUF1653 domain-containing protein [Patescibacteria group bacterium]
MSNIAPGIYTHFKDSSKEYEVIGTAFHTETEEEMVVYKPLYEGAVAELFVRPASMFLELVSKPELGYEGPRFIRVRDV